ncbi:Mobile element protein [Pseudomonas sessilinigenes]|nr:Mobile element protein [Pseudomonas sessilinigenes]
MTSLPHDLPDDPVSLKQLLLEALDRQEETAKVYQPHIFDLKEQIKLLRDRLFGRKPKQTVESNIPQQTLFNEPEGEPMPSGRDADEKVVAPTPRYGKRKPLSANPSRIEVFHKLHEQELTCTCDCRKHAIGKEISQQLDIGPMQIQVTKHVRKIYGCQDYEAMLATTGKPAQLMEKRMGSPSALDTLLPTKYVDGLPLHRFESAPSRHGIEPPRQTLARWAIQYSEHFQPLLNLMYDNCWKVRCSLR